MIKIGEIKHIANNHEAILDLDDVEFVEPYIQTWFQLIELCGLHVKAWTIECSSSGTGVHVIFTFKEKLKPIEQVAIQAILGSDPKREALNFRRKGLWNVLFASKHIISENNT